MSKYNPWVKPDPADHVAFVRSLTKAERIEVVEMMRRSRLPSPALDEIEAMQQKPLTARQRAVLFKGQSKFKHLRGVGAW